MLGEELQRGSGNGYITKPYIGVSVTDVSRETQNYGLPKGAAVRSITEDGPAADAGLEENDIITAINGEEISGSKALVDAVRGSRRGKPGKRTDDITLGKQIQIEEDEHDNS